MARARNPDRDKAKAIWLKSNKTAKLKDIAKLLGVSPGAVRKWKSEDKWNGETNRNVMIQKERSDSVKLTKAIEEADIPEKQKMFAMLYLQRFNATWAYMKAYGSSYATAMVEGSKSLRKPKIEALINALKSEQAAELHMTKMDILQDLAKQARADIGDYVEFVTKDEPVEGFGGQTVIDESTGQPKMKKRSHVYLVDQAGVDTSLIKSVRVGQDGPVVELYDKHKAMDMLLKNLPDQLVETDDDGFLKAIDQAKDKVWGEDNGDNK